MTLIMGLLTREYVLLVSDRRLVFPGPKGSYEFRDDDDHTKLVIAGHSAMFGYTGLAEIDGEATHEWLVGLIKPFVDQDRTSDGVRELAGELTGKFKMPRIRRICEKDRRHAFLCVGFKVRKSTGKLFPAADIISNFHDANGTEYGRARDEFVVRSLSLSPGKPLMLLAIGVVPTEANRHTELTRLLRRRIFLKDPLHAARLLAHEVRRVADADPDRRVGKGLLVCCIPIRYVLHGGTPGGPFDTNTLSYAYVPAAGVQQVSVTPAIAIYGSPILISEVRFTIPPPADGSDPYAEWRHELALPTKVFDRRLP